jgi:hypothetical protein
MATLMVDLEVLEDIAVTQFQRGDLNLEQYQDHLHLHQNMFLGVRVLPRDPMPNHFPFLVCTLQMGGAQTLELVY